MASVISQMRTANASFNFFGGANETAKYITLSSVITEVNQKCFHCPTQCFNLAQQLKLSLRKTHS